MEEILELKELLLKGDIKGSLAIVEELEEMSKDDKVNNIGSYGIILLLHLIKQQVENRSTRSWESSIRNSARAIQRKNKRRKAGGFYLTAEELRLTLEEVYPDAIDAAAREVEEGRYEPEELENLVNKDQMIDRALSLILPSE